MKLLDYKINSRLLVLVILIVSCSSATLFAQKNQKQDKIIKDKVLFDKIQTLKPEMRKADVEIFLGEPYKLSFSLTEEGDLVEDIYYKTEIWQTRWTIVIYQCVFKNSKLVALIQKEYFSDTSDIGVVGPL